MLTKRFRGSTAREIRPLSNLVRHKPAALNILIDHGSSHNLGDEAMLESVIRNLNQQFPDAQLCVVGRDALRPGFGDNLPAETVPRYALRLPLQFTASDFASRIRRRVTSGVQKYVLRRDDAAERAGLALLESGGRATDLRLWEPDSKTLGEYCEEYGGLHVVGGGNLTETFPWQLVHRLCLIRAFREQGKPAVLTGQQVGPFRTPKYRGLVAETLRRATFVGVREPTESVAFLRRAKVQDHTSAMMGDDAFGLPPAEGDSVEQGLVRHGLVSGQFIATNVRIGKSYAAEHSAHLSTLAGMIDQLADAYRMPVLVVPIALNDDDSDLHSGERLRELTKTADVRLLDSPGLTPSFVKGVMKHAMGAVGVSYHFCTFALSQGAPAVCVYDGAYYGQKAKGLAALWKEDRIPLALNGISPAIAADHVRTVWDDPGLRQRLQARSVDVVKAWNTYFEMAVAAFGQHPRSV